MVCARDKLVDSMWYSPLPNCMVALAVSIIDTLELTCCLKSCVTSFFIAWKFHGDGMEYSALRFVEEVMPYMCGYKITAPVVLQTELTLMQRLKWVVPGRTFWDVLPEVPAVYTQFMDRASLHALLTLKHNQDPVSLAWATVYYACYLSAFQLHWQTLVMGPSSSPDRVRVLLCDLFKSNRR